MNKKLVTMALSGIIFTSLLGCSNQSQPLQALQPNKTENVSISSTTGINNFIKNFTTIYFSMLDINKDNVLTHQEYNYANLDQLNTAFRKLDKNNDGKISLEDAKNSSKIFLTAASAVSSKEIIRTYIKNRYSSADTNKDSIVSETEFLASVNKEFAFFINNGNSSTAASLSEYMFGASDNNNDKKITFSEYEDFYYKITIAIMSASQVTPPPSPSPYEPVDPYPSDSPYDPNQPNPYPSYDPNEPTPYPSSYEPSPYTTPVPYKAGR